MNLAELFYNTWTIKYETVGKDVNYQFQEDGKTLYIYFQGSSGATDWKANFTFPAKPYKDMEIPYRVHRGFLKCWKQVEDIIIGKIIEKDNNGNYRFNRIITCGYSHGGALAAFCHECVWYYRQDIKDNIWGFGFEAPRIYAGFKIKKTLCERWQHFIVFRNNTDIVTHVPPILFCFTHVGNIYNIGRQKDYNCIKSHYPDKVLESLKEVSFDIEQNYLDKLNINFKK
jgi:hypothetical protein